ncbi:Lipase 3 [Halotydeus destructor]|nr:Lipase 3 [Halotydeus destructor]
MKGKVCQISLCLLLLVAILVQGQFFQNVARSLFDRTHDTCDIVESRGYVCETHRVTTSDQYILTVHRIVNPLRSTHGQPVFLQHGSLASDITWIIQGSSSDLGNGDRNVPIENELGFALSRRGYDVWMGNFRGSTYSVSHKKYPKSSSKFWEFSEDQKILIDLPEMVDYVIKNTEYAASMGFVGHSFGSIALLALMSRTNKYNEVIKPAILTAPAYYGTNSALQLGKLFQPFAQHMVENPGPFLTSKGPVGRGLGFLTSLCLSPVLDQVCALGWYAADGYDSPNIDKSRLNVYLAHLPAGESTWSTIHLLSQGKYQYEMRMFDYLNDTRNMAAYGSTLPPEYRVQNITSPHLATIRSSGRDDQVVQPEDYDMLRNKIGEINGFQLIYDLTTLQRAIYDRDHELCEIVQSRGYGCQVHKVTTSDGYILTLQRIVNPKRKVTGKPVFLQHGRLASGIIWVLQGPGSDLEDGSTEVPMENELGFALSRRGYDVWIGNVRGSTYSQEHVSLSTSSKEFWKYSNDEKALKDLPAMLDYVLETTNKNSIAYVGHSLGSAMMISLLSKTAKYNDQIKPVILTAPVWFITNAKDPMQFLLPEPIWPLFLNNPGPFAQNKRILGRSLYAISTLCFVPLFNVICAIGWFLSDNYDLPNLDITRLPVYLAHLPGGESTWSFLQPYNSAAPYWYQNRMFDFGSKAKNMAVYGSYEPPPYRVGDITSKYMCTIRSGGQDDWFVQPQDFKVFKQRLRVKLLDDYIVPLTNFSHLDHQLAKTAGVAENYHILTLLKKYA